MEDLKYNYIAVEGIIGSGKTTLVKLLCEEFSGTPVLEEFDENPFLPLFYSDPAKYSFPVEMSFLAERYGQLKNYTTSADLFAPLICDYVFSKSLLFAQINLNNEEYDLFRKMYDIIAPHLPQPDLVFYLYSEPEAAKKQIISRGRNYEQNIKLSYLDELQKSYVRLFERSPKQRAVLVDTTRLDFVQHRSHFNYLKQLLHKKYPKGITRIIPGKGDI